MIYFEFKHGRRSLTDEFKGGRPKSVVVPANIEVGSKQLNNQNFDMIGHAPNRPDLPFNDFF